MSQYRWTFYDPNQGTQTLGLYHGDKSGHVMIYLNQKVVIIDFEVHQSKSYSLMLNQSLLELKLNKDNGKFLYKFERTRIPDENSSINKLKSLFSYPFSK